jgi:predicted outer membrane lipoprotein
MPINYSKSAKSKVETVIREFLACIFSIIHAWFLNILDMLHKKIRMLKLFLNNLPREKLMCFQILGYW